MSGSVRGMSTGQAKDLSIVLAQSALTDLTFEQAKRLLGGEGKKRLMSEIRALQVEISTQAIRGKKDQMSHKDICIPFTITDKDGVKHHFEAVGFLKDGETSASIEEVYSRVGERVIISDEDWELFGEYSGQLPDELLQFGYLLTARPCPGDPGRVSCVDRSGRGWHTMSWVDLSFHCDRHGLVLRRAV